MPSLVFMMKSVVVAPVDFRDELNSRNDGKQSDAITETGQMNNLGFISCGKMREAC